MKKLLGTITSGSLTEGLIMRIDPETQLETIKTGKFVSVVGTQHVFFSLITDLALEVTNPDILLYPPAEDEKLLQKLLKQKGMYATAALKPMVMLNKDNEVVPVKTVPPH